MRKYAEGVDRLLSIETANPHINIADKRTFNEFYISAASVLEEIENYNILYGTLIRKKIFDNLTADNGTA